MFIVLTLDVFINAEESMNAEAVQGVQMQVKGHHALGNSYFSCWILFVLFLPSAIKMAGDV